MFDHHVFDSQDVMMAHEWGVVALQPWRNNMSQIHVIHTESNPFSRFSWRDFHASHDCRVEEAQVDKSQTQFVLKRDSKCHLPFVEEHGTFDEGRRRLKPPQVTGRKEQLFDRFNALKEAFGLETRARRMFRVSNNRMCINGWDTMLFQAVRSSLLVTRSGCYQTSRF
jgi:hypothetical protein